LSALIFPFPFENDNAFIVKMCHVCIHNPSKETGKLVCIIVEPKIVTSILSNCSAAVELLAKKNNPRLPNY